MASTARGAVAPLMGPSATHALVGEQTGRLVLTNYEQFVVDTTRSLVEGGQSFSQVQVSNTTTKAGNDIRADHPALELLNAEGARNGLTGEQTRFLIRGGRENIAFDSTKSRGGQCADQVQVGTTLTKAGNDVRADHGNVALLPFDLSRFGVGAIVGDLVPPTFGGLVSVVVSSLSSVTCSWSAGSDTTSSPSNLTYEVHVSTSASQPFAVRGTVKGATSLVITDLLPGQTYYFRARCRDEAGNFNANAGAEISVTPDVAPTFAGATGVAALGLTSARVSWSAATDDHDLAASITYRVHMSTSALQPFVPGFEVVGATHLDIVGLTPGTTYYFKVRAFDTSNVGDTNSVEVSVTLSSDNPPTFAGVQTAVPAGPRSGALTWAAGSDDVTPTGSLVYEIHYATAALQPFVTRAVSAAGATSATITGLLPSTRYYVKVRCRDLAGQLDTNVVELTFVTPDDVSAHPVIGNITPSAGTPISRDQAITFDVTDPVSAFRRIIVEVTNADTGIAEVVHNGDTFLGFYSGLSGRSLIANGWRYSVRRSGGWTGSPSFRVYAVDITGLENA